MRPYKYLHSFFVLRVGHFKIFQHFVFTFPQMTWQIQIIHADFERPTRILLNITMFYMMLKTEFLFIVGVSRNINSHLP
jgi:hypothetical protein